MVLLGWGQSSFSSDVVKCYRDVFSCRIESRRDKRSSQEKASPSPVNGSAPPNPTGAPPSSTPPTTAASGQAMVPGYPGYQQAGYGNYNQGYPQGYGASHYQGWGYPTQQGGYGYGQQGWGTYGNYYGQR